MDTDKKYCVYMHTCKHNQKKYIGITCQKPKDRWANGKGYINNQYFYRAIQKYGWNDGFVHEIIKDDISKEEAQLLEIELIKSYDTMNRDKGYNIYPGGDLSRAGIPQKPETIELLKTLYKTGKTKHKIFSGADHPNSKPVYQYDYTGKYVRSYVSATEAASVTGFQQTDISKCCHNAHCTCHGNYFSFHPHEQFPVNTDYVNRFKTKIFQYDTSKNLIHVYENMDEISRLYGSNYITIKLCCDEIAYHYKGFIWCYEYNLNKLDDYIYCSKHVNEYKGVAAYNQYGVLVKTYQNISDVVIDINCPSRSAVCQVCLGLKKSYKGLIYRYIYDTQNIPLTININKNNSKQIISAKYSVENSIDDNQQKVLWIFKNILLKEN